MKNKSRVVALALTALLLFSSCAGGATSSSQAVAPSTDTWSTAFISQQEKIDFLTTYVDCPTDVLDAEYHIVFQNNSGEGKGRIAVPAPSDWDMLVAVRVAPQDVAAWADGMEEIPIEEANLVAWDVLPREGDEWETTAVPTAYRRPDKNSWLVVYAPDGVVLKYFTTYGVNQPTAFT